MRAFLQQPSPRPAARHSAPSPAPPSHSAPPHSPSPPLVDSPAAEALLSLACLLAAEAFVPHTQPALRSGSKLALSKAAPKMSLPMTAVDSLSSTLAGVVAVDGGTVGCALRPHAREHSSNTAISAADPPHLSHHLHL